VTIEVKKSEKPKAATTQPNELGIDLGLNDLMCAADGQKVDSQRFYRDLEPALATAQRANKTNRTKATHAKIANRRKD
jgi:transposase